ncbi:MAG: hypothetical protein Tsb0019_32240 [Roseibium sp.]
MEERIGKHRDTDHAPDPGNAVPRQDPPERCDRKGQDQEPHGPVPASVQSRLVRVGAHRPQDKVPENQTGWKDQADENGETQG